MKVAGKRVEVLSESGQQLLVMATAAGPRQLGGQELASAVADNVHIDPHVGVFASYDYTSKMKTDGESISWGDYADYMEVDYNHFDAGMNIGVGVWYDRFNLDLTYQRGFIDTFSDADGFKTSNFMIRLGIAF